MDKSAWLETLNCTCIQWNLLITDKLVQELLSVIQRCPLLGGFIINLTPYQFMLKMVRYKFKINSDIIAVGSTN